MREQGVIGIASKLVSVDEKYQKLVDALLGKTIIVENLVPTDRLYLLFNTNRWKSSGLMS